MVAWSYSKLFHPDDALLSALCGSILRHVDQFSEDNLCAVLRSLAILGALTRPLWDAALGTLVRSSHTKYLSVEALSQLFQAAMLCQAQQPEVEWPMDAELMRRAKDSWAQAARDIS